MLLLSSGIIIGILLSLLAIIAGKKFSDTINSEKPLFSNEKGYIIKNEPDIDRLLKQ